MSRNLFGNDNFDPEAEFNRNNNNKTYSKWTGDNSSPENTEARSIGGGILGDEFIEPVPQRIKAKHERVIANSNNAWIVLGRDRPASLASGYGAKGVNGAGCIDLCVGMMAGSQTGPKQTTKVHPNFASDAARIYISQKTDIDENFGLDDGIRQKIREGSTKGRSGVGIKADGVRIVARSNGIKLVTGKGKFLNTGATGEKDSKGETVFPTDEGTIELIVGNDTTEFALSEFLTPAVLQLLNLFYQIPNKIKRLQPMIKGDNLVLCLQTILAVIDKIMTKLNVLCQLFNANLVACSGAMTTLVPTFGTSAAAYAASSAVIAQRVVDEIIGSVGVIPILGDLKQQIINIDNNYLKPQGTFYINSRHCSLT
jgi:hypothetical protein